MHFSTSSRIALISILLGSLESVLGCNEAVCASIVSKCMLTQSCKCDDFKTNKTCSRDCYHCLDYLYQDCCSCVEMCPKTNTNDSLSSKSHVEDLQEPQPDLFNVLTEEKDHLSRWTSYSIPVQMVYLESVDSEVHKEVKFASKVTKSDSDGFDREEDISLNCTVAFMSQCMSWNKCKSSCTSMGANSYRWFHDGCCQCVGAYCVNYGINESRCLQCPLTTEHDVGMSIDENDHNEKVTDDDDDNDNNNNNYGNRRDDDEDNREHNSLTDDKFNNNNNNKNEKESHKKSSQDSVQKKPNV